MSKRTKVVKKAAIRARAHEALDEVLDLYERDEPLWLVQQVDWSGKKIDHSLVLVIRPSDPFEE